MGDNLVVKVVIRENLEVAVKSVMRNIRAAGIDGMTVFEIKEHIKEYCIPLRNKLFNGSYKPQPVKRVEIPKLNGEKRNLGIPCVRDRVVPLWHLVESAYVRY